MASPYKNTWIGKQLGVYRIDALLGSGGMGDVYAGVHEVLGRHVAIKTLKPGISSDEGSMRRFFDEARTVNKIRHENIVEVTDLSSEPGGPSYMVMELLQGRTLTDAIREVGQIPPERTVLITAQIASALVAAHALDVVHRDLKPDNVFLIHRAGSPDYVKLLDFGIARLRRLPEDQGATATGMYVGTPAYMSPEQVEGKKGVEITPAADIYSFGIILFQMLTGRLPFEGSSVAEVMYRHLTVEPPRVGELSPHVPARLADLIGQCLAKQPSDRPGSMRELRTELLLSVGLDPGDFEIPQPPSMPWAAASNAKNAVDSQADSMWSGATLDSTGNAGERNLKQAVAAVARREEGPPEGPEIPPGKRERPTSDLRGSARDRPAPVAQSTHNARGPVRKRALSEAEKIQLGSLDTMAPRAGGTDEVDTSTPPVSGSERALRVVAVPTPSPVRPTLPADHARTRRNIWLMIGAVVAVFIGAIVLVLGSRYSGRQASSATDTHRERDALSSERASETPANESLLRAKFDRAVAGHDEPVAPETCQTRDDALLERLTRAATGLREGVPGESRDSDVSAASELLIPAAESAEYWYWLGKARLFTTADGDAVEAAATRAVKLCDAYAAAHNLLGTARFRAGDAAGAHIHYARALTLDASFVLARYNLGLVQLQLGRVQDGVDTLTQVLESRPDKPEALLARGQGYLALGRHERALADLQIATRSLSDNAAALYALGVAYQRNGLPEQAREAMCKASELGHESAAEFCTPVPASP